MKRFILLAGVAVGACAVAGVLIFAGCKGSEPLAASVNGDPITEKEFYTYLELKPQVQVIVNPAQLQAGPGGNVGEQKYSGQVVGTLGLQAMNELVQQAILRQMAKDEGVEPTAQQIEEEINNQKKDTPDFLKRLTDQGYSLEMIRKNIAVSLSQYNLITKGIKISDDEVSKYIAEHPKEFETPEMVDMLWIQVPNDQKKKEATDDLNHGREFIQVAQQYSVAPDAGKYQYHFPERRVTALPPQLAKLIHDTTEQKDTDWIAANGGWAKFHINKKDPAKPMLINDDVKTKLRKLLAIQRGGQGKDIESRIQDRMKKANIQIFIEHLKEPWKLTIENSKNTPGTNGTAAPGSGGTSPTK